MINFEMLLHTRAHTHTHNIHIYNIRLISRCYAKTSSPSMKPSANRWPMFRLSNMRRALVLIIEREAEKEVEVVVEVVVVVVVVS